jgi:hypothetical protein
MPSKRGSKGGLEEGSLERSLSISPETERLVRRFAVSSLQARGDYFDIVPAGLFDWIPASRLRRDSLFGVALAPLLKIFSTIHGPMCNCHRQVLLWNYLVAETAESRGWAPEDLTRPLATLTHDNYYFLLEAAFFSFARELGIDLSSPRERVRCEKIVLALPDDLVSDATFKRVICKFTGGWLLAMGPKALKRDRELLMDILSTERCDPDFLPALEEDFLMSCPEILLLWPGLMEKYEVFGRSRFILEVLALDHRFAKHLRRSMLELPRTAVACGGSFLARLEKQQRKLISASLPWYPIDELVALLSSTNGMLEDFFFRQGKLNSKLRGALVAYALALADYDCFEPWEPLFKLCQKLARLVLHQTAPSPLAGDAGAKQEERGISAAETHRTAAAAAREEESSSRGPEAQQGTAEQQQEAKEKDLEGTPAALEIEITMANENARIEKLSHQRAPPSSTKSRYRKKAKKARGARDGDAGGEEATEVPAAEQKKNSTTEHRSSKEAPLLLSDKPLDELLQPVREKQEGRSLLDRKLRKREGRTRKREEQQQRLASVFL